MKIQLIFLQIILKVKIILISLLITKRKSILTKSLEKFMYKILIYFELYNFDIKNQIFIKNITQFYVFIL